MPKHYEEPKFTPEELKAEEILDYAEMMIGKDVKPTKRRNEALKEIEFMLNTN